MIGLYRGATSVLGRLAPVALRWFDRHEPEMLRQERLARVHVEPAGVWWHAASLGEVGALAPILAALGDRVPFAVTTQTRSGREAARSRWGPRVTLAPLDVPAIVERALAVRDPRALVLVETELWPNWLHAAARRGVRTAVVNGRLSDRRWSRTRRWRAVLAPSVRGLSAVAARTHRDAERFLELGARPEAVRVTGNTKYDRLEPAPRLEMPWSGGPVWVFGSLRPGEESVALGAFSRLRAAHPGLRLVLAPRHPERQTGLAAAVRHAGFTASLRSNPDDEDDTADVLVLDTQGELAGAYAAATVASVGGTWTPVGGHNPLEPAAASVPVTFGPSRFGVREETDRLIAAGGGAEAADATGLADVLDGWLADPDRARTAGAAGRAAVDALGGAVARTLDWLVEREVLESWR